MPSQFPPDISPEEPNLVPDYPSTALSSSPPNISSEDPTSVTCPPITELSSSPFDISTEDPPLDSYPALSDYTSGDPSLFPVLDPTEMLQKYLHKAQIAVPIVSKIITHAPAAALLHLESLKMIIQEAVSKYTTDVSDYNEYLMQYHAILDQHITGLLKDHYMNPVDLPYLSPNPSSFPTSLPSDIPEQSPTSVPTSTHMNCISELTSILPYPFPSKISSDKPISHPTSFPSEYKSDDSYSSSLPHSRFPYITTL